MLQVKKFLLFFGLLFTFSGLFAQETPVRWNFKAEKIGNNEYNIVCTANIQTGWATYSQYQEGNDGPIPTSISYTAKNGVEMVGKNEETGHLKIVDDKLFGMKVSKFTDEVFFTQHVKIAAGTKSIKGFVTYMCCNDEICMPPKDVPFEVMF
jgi:DsbC/DsbD-like thiol-disulfide interchange protein